METPKINGWECYFNIPILSNILINLENLPQNSITPSWEKTFRAFKLCSPKECKAILVAQDPYPQEGVATGLAFANDISTPPDKISPSLRVIRDAVLDPRIPRDNPCYFDISLESWAKQGVLLLNAALTVNIGAPGSHVEIWRPFMSRFLADYSTLNQGRAYLFFGKQAANYEYFINPNNKILEVYHPAYFARIGRDMSSKPFDSINEYLCKQYGEEAKIKWFTEG